MRSLILFFLVALSLTGTAQMRFRHAASAELSSVVMVRYDYMFKPAKYGFWNLGASAGAYTTPDPTHHNYVVRANGSYIFGSDNSKLEAGIMFSSIYRNFPDQVPTGVEKQETDIYTGPVVGYRYIGNKGLAIRLYIGCGFGSNTYPFWGVGLGWAFGKTG